MTMHPANEQAAALSFELNTHLGDLLDDAGEEGLSVPLVSEDDDLEVGRFTELGQDGNDHSFLVRTEDGTVLRVTVEVAE